MQLPVKVAFPWSSGRGSSGRADDSASVPTARRKASQGLDRWSWTWHAAFYVVLLTVAVTALFDLGESWGVRGGALSLAAGLAAWHGLGILGGFNRRSVRHGYWSIGYIAVGWAIWFTAAGIQEDYELVAIGMLIQLFAFTTIRWAMAGCLSLVALVILIEVVVEGNGLGTWTIQAFINELFLILVMLYIDAIDKRSVERQRLIDQLESTRGQLAASERQAGVLQERERLGREIHDTLAQGFTSIIMHHEAAETALPEIPAAARKHLDQAHQTARESLAEARRLVWALTPEALDRASLPEAMDQVAQRWSETGGSVANVVVTGTVRALHPSVEVTVLRATQEALSNARKHSGAGKVNVTLSYMDDEVVLDVQDDGMGFDPDRASKQLSDGSAGGFGLVAMRQRVDHLGGTLLIESAPGDGTTLVVNLPIGAQDT